MTFTAPPIRITLYIGAVHLLVIYGSLLDGQAALVVLNVLLEAGNVLGSRSDADASVACKDNLLEIISQRKFVGIIHGVTSQQGDTPGTTFTGSFHDRDGAVEGSGEHALTDTRCLEVATVTSSF